MSKLPTAPEQENSVRLEYRKYTDAFAGNSAIPNLTEDIEAQTAQILAFPSQKKIVPKKIIPTYVVGTDITYKPNAGETEQNELIGQILKSVIFWSKEEQFANQKTNHENVESLIETRFYQTMQLAAREDVQNSVFG